MPMPNNGDDDISRLEDLCRSSIGPRSRIIIDARADESSLTFRGFEMQQPGGRPRTRLIDGKIINMVSLKIVEIKITKNF